MRLVSALVGALLVALVSSAASAQVRGPADQQALALYEQGSAAYTEGRYEDAVRAFSEAYRLSPRPLLLFNLANAYERIGRYRAAAEMLEGYLPHAPPQERATLSARITNLRARPDVPEAAPGDDLLVPVGIAVGATGVALVAAGIVLGVLALDARSAAEGLCREGPNGGSLCLQGADGHLADAELFAALADAGLFGGGAVAAAGLVLLVIGLSGSSGGGSAALVPDMQVGPAGASIGLRGRF